MYNGNIVFVYNTSPVGRHSAMWLVEWPIASLTRKGYFVESVSLNDVLSPTRRQRKILSDADIIFYERHVDDPWMEFFDWAIREKRFYILLDDAHWCVHPSEPSYAFWSTNDRLQKLMDVAEASSGVVAPSKKLAGHFSNGIFKPNRPDLLDPCWSIAPLHDEKVILWGGTSGHIGGMQGHPCLEAIDQLTAENECRFIAIYGSPAMKSLLEKSVRNVTYTSFLPYSEWLRVLSGATVSICPIGDEYDEHRSWIKALESSFSGTPWVASDNGVYEDCEGGVEVTNTVEAWYESLKWLLNEDKVRNEMRNDGLAWSWRQGLDDHLHEWEAIFNG